MRILYFYQYFTTPRGAWSTRVYENARRWVERGDRVTVVTSVYDRSDLRPRKLVERFDVEGIDVVVLNIRLSNKHGVLMRLYTFAAYAALACWYALRHPADVVVASSGPITVGIPGLVARYLARRPLVFEVRDLWPEGAIQLGFLRSRPLIGLARWFERACYRAASAVVACSPGQAEWVRRVDSRTDVVVVPNASDNQLADELGRFGSRPAWARGKKLVVYTGTIGLINDCGQIVDAAQILQDRGADDVLFVMVGDGKERAELERTAEERSLRNIRFLGSRSKEESMRWLLEATCTLFTVKDVPFLATASPNKVFDAFAAGVPIVQNSHGWIRELLREEQCGITVPPGDPEAMGEAIGRLIGDPGLRDEMGRNARRVGEERFDRDLLAERMRRVLASAAGLRPEGEEVEPSARAV